MQFNLEFMEIPAEEEKPRLILCRKCNRMLPVENFYREGKARRGYKYKCKDCCKEYQTSPYGRMLLHNSRKKRKLKSPARFMFRDAKDRARRFDMEFSLELSDIEIPDCCPIRTCAAPLVPGTAHAPSIDRIDSSRGYTPDNIAIICKRCNQYKSNMAAEHLLELARYVLQKEYERLSRAQEQAKANAERIERLTQVSGDRKGAPENLRRRVTEATREGGQ